MQDYHFGAPSAHKPLNSNAPVVQMLPKNAPAEQFEASDRRRPMLPASGKGTSLVTCH